MSIETLILVAAWQQPAIFQGCFKLSSEDPKQAAIFLFFRCEYANEHRAEHVDDSFSPNDFTFSHLYNQTHSIALDQDDEGITYAEYILKYALYKTLVEMQSKQTQKFMSIDDEAMQVMVKKVEPMLQQAGVWETLDEHLGFAVSMDFHPQERMGQLGIEALFALGAFKA